MITEIIKCLEEYEILITILVPILVSVGILMVGHYLQKRARKIQSLLVWNHHRIPIQQFAGDAVDTLSKVEGLCEVDPVKAGKEFQNKRNELISEISALRDKGKFILPNECPDSYGMHKSSAYQGYRHQALDCLAAAFYFAVAIDYSKFGNNKQKASIQDLIEDSRPQLSNIYQLLNIKKARKKLPSCPSPPAISGFREEVWSCKSGIVECKRQFVSIIQEILEPQHWNEQIKNVSKT